MVNRGIMCSKNAACTGLDGHTGECRIASGIAFSGENAAVKIVGEGWKCGDCEREVDPTKLHEHVCSKASTLPAPPNDECPLCAAEEAALRRRAAAHGSNSLAGAFLDVYLGMKADIHKIQHTD